jgi:hypothetical protein
MKKKSRSNKPAPKAKQSKKGGSPTQAEGAVGGVLGFDQSQGTGIQLTKLEAAQRQLETAVKLYCDYGDEVSIHTLVLRPTRSFVTSIGTAGGGSMIKDDLNGLLPPEDIPEFRKYINSPDNFLKHADKTRRESESSTLDGLRFCFGKPAKSTAS